MALIPTSNPDDKIKILVCVPSHDMCPTMWAHDFAAMLTYTASALHGKVMIGQQTMTNTYIHKARQELIEQALEIGTHYILFVDSDMRFPKDALIRLLARDLPIVGINYPTRRVPSQFTAIDQIGWVENHHEGKRVPTLPWSTGTEKVEAVGGGLLLMKAVIFQNLPKPWFFFEYDPDSGQHIGEDVYFCRLLTKHGWDIHIDHELSNMCSHIGQFEYKNQHAAELWLAEEEEKQDGADDLQRAEDSDLQPSEQD